MKKTESLLASYPRQRPELSMAHQEIYLEEIQINRGEMGGLFYRLMGWLESWMHKQVGSDSKTESILEIGAGTLNHMDYEPNAITYNIIEPINALYAESPHRPKVNSAYADISEVALAPAYTKIVSIAALEHVTNLPDLLARIGLILEDHGQLRVGIPSEGGFLWGASWRCTTGVLFKLRTGLAYKPLMRYEHINEANEIIALTRLFFENVKVRRFPLPWLHFSFYHYIEAAAPKREYCQEFLNNS